MNLTMQEGSRSITEKFRKELKSEDFLLMSQENREYQQLVKVMQEKEGILNNKIVELQKALMRMENQKDEYKALCQEYTLKLNSYDQIKNQLLQEYKILKGDIERSFEAIATKDVEIAQLRRVNEGNVEILMELQQKGKRDGLVIQELRQYVGKLQKDIIQQKITTFSHLIDHQSIQGTLKKENMMAKSNKNNASASFKSSTINASSKTSNTNSISFSLVSNDSLPPHKSSISKRHNKSIYL